MDRTGPWGKPRAEHSTAAPGAHHHPKLTGVTVARDGRCHFEFSEFTGEEEEPVVPADADPETSDHHPLRDQYARAHHLWLIARFRRATAPGVAAAHLTWDAYAQARERMRRAFRDLLTRSDGHWHAGVLRLIPLQAFAIDRSAEWGQAVDFFQAQLVEVFEPHRDNLGGLLPQMLAAAHGPSVERWETHGQDWGIAGEVEAQKTRIEQVANILNHCPACEGSSPKPT